jgi:hypothetical protein
VPASQVVVLVEVTRVVTHAPVDGDEDGADEPSSVRCALPLFHKDGKLVGVLARGISDPMQQFVVQPAMIHDRNPAGGV